MAQEKYLDFTIDACERLKIELYFAEDFLTKAIGEYLLEQFNKDSVLKQCYFDRKITLEETAKFVNNCAEKRLGHKSGAISDEEVFGWVLHYVQDEKVIIKKEKTIKIENDNAVELTEEQKEELNKKAQEQYLAEQKEKIKKQEENKIKKQKEKRKESGQLSLFDL